MSDIVAHPADLDQEMKVESVVSCPLAQQPTSFSYHRTQDQAVVYHSEPMLDDEPASHGSPTHSGMQAHKANEIMVACG
jgi:hypothetical protein